MTSWSAAVTGETSERNRRSRSTTESSIRTSLLRTVPLRMRQPTPSHSYNLSVWTDDPRQRAGPYEPWDDEDVRLAIARLHVHHEPR
jgi:hypothetical protein